MDPETFRAQARTSWERAAAGWESRGEQIRRCALPVSAALVELARPRPGQRILEVAAGLGDTGLLAAERVRPGGEVLITDGAEAMVEAARRRVAESGADNVEVRLMEAEWLDLPVASVDAIVSRWGYRLLADPEAALRDARRVLRPGGRIALAAWAPLELNPWIGVLQGELLARGLAPQPEPGAPGMFALAPPGRVEGLLADTGFEEIEVADVDFAWEAESLDAWWEHQLAVSVSLGQALAGLSPAEHHRLRDALDAGYAKYVAPGGAVRLPARARLAAASA